MNINKDKLTQLCCEYHIEESIPYSYIDYLSKPGHYYQDLPCGRGKTMGLAIAAACCDELCFNYVASTHSRLFEFVDTLARFKVPYYYMQRSAAVLQSNEDYPLIWSSRIIILTSSMLLQFDYSKIEFYAKGKDLERRSLVIDELPKVLLPIEYDWNAWDLFHNLNFTRFTKYWYYQIRNLFYNEDLVVTFDEALNNAEAFKLDKMEKLLRARVYILNLLKERNLQRPKDYSEDLDNYVPSVSYLKIRELYTSRAKTSIILDATSDLYSEILEAVPMSTGVKKDYSEFIGYCCYHHLGIGFSQRDRILDDFYNSFISQLDSIYQFEGPYYLVTHNSSVYDGMGSEKTANEELIGKLQKNFTTIYFNDNKDFILCRRSEVEVEVDDFGRVITEPDDIFISNFARSRGSNYFRDCRTVWILGTFYIPESELSKMIEENHFNISPSKLQKNLAVADAVQEISRGCIRKRNSEEKMNLIMMGDKNVIEEVIKYLGVENATEF